MDLADDKVSELYIQSVLVMSTGHVTEQDSVLLEKWVTDLQTPFWVVSTSYGWMVWVDPDSIPDMLDKGGSPALGQLIQVARDNGCDWLRLDADVPMNDGFPTFDW